MTIKEVKELIKIDETRVVEFKKTTGELKDAMHSVCAMLNSDGGYVIIGIAPKSLNELVNPGTFPPQLTEESIRSNHESYPYNKRIAQVLYLTKNLEKWGTGANRMIDLCREQGVPEPEWNVENGTVSIIFKRPFVTLANEESSEDNHRNFIETSQKKCEKFIETLQKKDREIAELVITNSEITQNEMAKVLGITTRAVANRLKSMQERDIIKRVGPDNGGHWELIISE